MYDRYSFKNDLGRAGMVLLVLLAARNMMTMPFLWMQLNSQMTTTSPAFTPLISALASLITYLAAMVLTLYFAVHILQRKPAFLFPMGRVRPDYALPAVGAGIMAMLGGGLATSLLLVLLQGFGLTFRTYIPQFGQGLGADFVTLLNLLLLPPILEELLFRGALLQALRRYGDRLAIVVSALLFAACHSTLPQMLNAFLAGLVLGLFTVRSGSLLPAMVIHLLNNGLAVLQALLLSRQDLQAAAVWNLGTLLALVLLGSLCCLFLSRRFGRVWWVARGGTPAVPRGDALRAIFTSPPILTALALYLLEMLRYNWLG